MLISLQQLCKATRQYKRFGAQLDRWIKDWGDNGAGLKPLDWSYHIILAYKNEIGYVFMTDADRSKLTTIFLALIKKRAEQKTL